jgi:twinkle protein
MEGMNQKSYGIRLGELDVFTSGTGMGKTTLIKQFQHHFMQTTDLNQALIHLEEPLEDTAEGIIGIHIGKRLNLPDVREFVPDEDYWQGFDDTFGAVDDKGNSRLNVYDAFGSLDETDLYNKVRYFATGLDCKIIWIDHLSILVSDLGQDSQDERRAIDSIMHNLKMLTQELGIYIGLISHLKKAPQGRSFEEGYVPSSDDLRGSGSIKQLSNNVYAISRNQQEEDDTQRNTSTLTVLKCRYTGRTGKADYLLFDESTGRMVQGSSPDAQSVYGASEF